MTNYTVSQQDSKWLIVTLTFSALICWILQELMERKFGFEPIIITELQLHEKSLNHEKPSQYFKIILQFCDYNLRPSICWTRNL